MPLVKKHLKNRLNFKMAGNHRYSDNTYLKFMVSTAITRNFAEGSSAQFNHAYHLDSMVYGFEPSKISIPNGDTLLYHIKKFDEMELHSIFHGVNEGVIQHAVKAGIIPQIVTVAIDCTDIPYYGKKRGPMVIRKKPDRGTKYAHRYATITIVENGFRFILETIAVEKHTPMSSIVEKLLCEAHKQVKIRYVLLDRGFYSVDVIKVLKKHDCKFLMPGKKTTKVENLKKRHGLPLMIRYLVGDSSNNVRVNLVAVKDKDDEERAFITNIENLTTLTVLSKTANAFYKGAAALYSKRWGIETTYRVTKQNFLARTCSKNPIIRLFYMLLAGSLYNLWQLAINTIPELLVKKIAASESRAKIFGIIILGCLRILDTGPPDSQDTPPRPQLAAISE